MTDRTVVDAAGSNQPDPQEYLALIVVAPIEGWDRWIAAIQHAASQAGLDTVIATNADDLEAARPNGDRILVTHDASLVGLLQARQRVAMLTDVSNALSWACVNGHALGPTVVSISRSMALAGLLGQLLKADASSGSIALWPGFVLDVQPDPLARIGEAPGEAESAAAEALSVLSGAGSLPAARWREPLFHYDQKLADRPNPAVIETSGRARALVWGPYIHLPAGVWRVTARFSVENGAEAHQFRAEWGTPEPTLYSSHAFRPGREGIFEIVIEYKWLDVAPAEFRMIQTEGSLGGTFTFMGLQLERVDHTL